MSNARQWRCCATIERYVVLWDPVWLRVRGDKSLPGRKNARRATEAGTEGVLSAPGILRKEVLNACGRGKAERVDALIIIASNKDACALGNQPVHELQVHRIQVLELVHDEM